MTRSIATATPASPFPYFGGKRVVAAEVWRRFGDVGYYVEPFFGSGAVLLGRPNFDGQLETVNDLDGYIANFWRAVAAEPQAVARYADWPVNENDLHARHLWLLNRNDALHDSLNGDPDYYDAQIAGWWVWGMACWIGGGFCSGQGPWQSVDGKMVKVEHLGDNGRGVKKQRPHLGSNGQGVNKKRPWLIGYSGQGVQKPSAEGEALYEWFDALSVRLRRVRVCSGDWSRVCGPSVTFSHGLTGVFLDPPYSVEAGRDNSIYRVESQTVAHDCRAWAMENETNPLMRIALCGYVGEHEELAERGWTPFYWKAAGGYGNQGDDSPGRANSEREVIWFSPHCLKPADIPTMAYMFEEMI